MKIRRAMLSDLDEIQNLNYELFMHDSVYDDLLNLEWPYQENGENFFRKSIVDEDRCCYVAENDEKELIGYLTGFVEDISGWRVVRRAELSNMLVAEKYRNCGVGKKLINAFFDWGNKNDVDKFFVSAYARNENAVTFYERNGFVPYEIGFERGK